MLQEEKFEELILIYHGSDGINFSHASCFVRTKNFKNNKQLLLLDCKNNAPIICPRKVTDQFTDWCSLDVFDDIEGKG